MKVFLVIVAVLTGCVCMAEPLVSLEDEFGGEAPSGMMYRYLREQASSAFAARLERYESLQSIEDIQAYQEDLRSFFVNQLGGFPERTPLNARIVSGGETAWFRYEKIIFEGLPGFYVTGMLYLPKKAGTYPGIIVPCGHSANGKASEAYQRASMLLAANGMAAFCYDPIGQGERYAYLKEDGSNEFGATLEHTLLGVGAILTGLNTATYRIWDGMRAIDYLQSRSDIDPDRIGCTGNSGGGTLTSYLMALDDRIYCAAPSCYLTTFEKLLDSIGPQDAEQNIFGQIAYGLDHADYIHLRAPKPTLICSATQDFFDIDGTWETFREAKRLFSRMGYSERVDLIENDDKHGFNLPQREAAARWMSRWLLNEDRLIGEPEFTVFTDEEMLCTPQGQVMLLDGAVSVLDLNAERARKLAETRTAYRKTVDDRTFRERITELIGLQDAVDAQRETSIKALQGPDSEVREMLIIRPEPGIALRAYVRRPASFTGDYVIICHEHKLETILEDDTFGAALVGEGHALCLVELRGLGETANDSGAKGWKDQIGPDWQDYFLAYLLGKSYVGMRTRDIWTIADYLLSLDERPLRLVASGQATVPALHAVALRPELFAHLTLEEGIPSWTEVVQTPRARHQLMNAVHDALSWYDLPDLIGLLPPEAVHLERPGIPKF